MKRLLIFLLTLMLCAPALAEQTTTVLGHMPDGEYIHQYVAPNGQLLWFTALEEQPGIKLEDVNFDGAEDIVIHVVRGASNFYAEFFLYDAQQDMYVLATHPSQEEGICNYDLHPELGLVESMTNNGNAGLLHVWNLYRWEGTELKLIRSAVSDEWFEDHFDGQTYTQIIHGDTLHVTVRDHGQAFEETVLWELVIPKDELENRDVFAKEMNALWQGLR